MLVEDDDSACPFICVSGKCIVVTVVFCSHIFSYNSSTGIFTVPSGGDGLYYFSTYLLVHFGKHAAFTLRVNEDYLCSAYGDNNANGANDYPQATCSGLVRLNEGRNTLMLFAVYLF